MATATAGKCGSLGCSRSDDPNHHTAWRAEDAMPINPAIRRKRWRRLLLRLLPIEAVAVLLASGARLVRYESIIVTGPVLGLLGVLTCVGSYALRYMLGFVTGAMQAALCVAFFLLAQSDAAIIVPLLAGAGFNLFYVPVALLAVRDLPPDRDTSHCDGCGYALYGLTSGRCPEC